MKRELEEKKKRQNEKKEPLDCLVAVPSLPEDCLFHIILRLPLESLIASRFVSKEWYGIINRSNFVDAHLQRASIGLIYLAEGCSSSHVGQASSSSAMKIEFNVDAKVLELDSVPSLHWHLFNPRTRFQIKFLEIEGATSKVKEYNVTCTGQIKAACNGLIVIENLVKGKGLIVMNPVTRELVTIPLGTMRSSHQESYGLAFCNESSRYKLVHLFQDPSQYIGCEIMHIGGRRWRGVDGPPHGFFGWLGYEPVFAIGALHWIPRVDNNDYLVSMPLKDEKFLRTPLPKSGGRHDRALEIGGVLGFVSHQSANQIDVWMLKSLGGGGWAKQHSIVLDSARNMVPLFCARNGSELVFMNGSGLYAYDRHLQLMRKIEVNHGWSPSRGCIFPHVNSLVSSRIKLDG